MKNLETILYPIAVVYSFISTTFFILNRKILEIYVKRKFMKVGRNLSFHVPSSSFTYNKIEIGDNVFINRGADFRGMVTIGNNVMFGPYVYITDGRHEYEKIGEYIRNQGSAMKARIYIEDDCWIGARSMITRGVRIGEGTVIGGMSVVTKNMPPYTICVGNPCKPVKKRYTDEYLRKHLGLMGKNEEEIIRIINKRNEMLSSMGAKIDQPFKDEAI